MRRSAPQTPPREQRSRKTFTIIGTTALGCTLALSPALPAFNTAPAALAHEEHSAGTAQAEPRSYTGNYIVRGVHTELLNAELHNGKLALNSKAETQDGEGLFNPSTTVFNLPANDQSQTRVTAGYDFIAPEGTPIWYIPQKHTDGLLYPSFSAENIPQGALKNNKITVELVKSEVPEGARAEVFQENLSGASRMFSTADRLAPYELEAGSHVHAAWAFTAAGTYRFTFRTSTELADGTQVHAEATYTVAVGEVPQDIFEQGHRAQNPQGSAESAAAQPQHEEGGEQAHRDAAPNERSSEEDHGAGNSRAQHQVIEPAHQESSSVEAAPAQPDSSADAAPNPQIATGDDPAPDAPAPAPQQAGQNAGAPNHTVNGSNAQNVTAPTVRGAGSGGSGASGNTAPSSGSRGGSYPGTESEKCIPTEVVVKDSVQSRSTQSPANIPGTLPMVTTADHAAADRATEGHFDVGPVLNGSTLSSAVKDDRFSPPKHVSPGSLEFVLGDAAKLKFPAGMEDIAPAGSTVHMIGATQQAGVPWLGWSTQDPELLKQADGPVTMSLKGFDGPGSMSVFLSGNFGSAGQKVFTSRGGSFQVPLNTHQHSNWVFTAEGRYRVTIGWQVRLKNGQTVESTSTLNFTVGNGSGENTSGGDKQQGAQKPADDGGHRGGAHNDTPAGESKTPDKQAGRGTVDAASGIVTKPDGTKVRIVGKTASGKDCALTNQELKDAQQAAAAGQLASTGAGFNPFMVSTSVLAVALGGMIVYAVRRRKRHAA